MAFGRRMPGARACARGRASAPAVIAADGHTVTKDLTGVGPVSARTPSHACRTMSASRRRRLSAALLQFFRWLIHSGSVRMSTQLTSRRARSLVRCLDVRHAILAVRTVRRKVTGLLAGAWDTLGSWHDEDAFWGKGISRSETALGGVCSGFDFRTHPEQVEGGRLALVGRYPLDGLAATLRPGELEALRKVPRASLVLLEGASKTRKVFLPFADVYGAGRLRPHGGLCDCGEGHGPFHPGDRYYSITRDGLVEERYSARPLCAGCELVSVLFQAR